MKAGANAAEDGLLEYAINYGKEATVHKLLQAGADAGPDIKTKELLYLAASRRSREMVFLLLQAGAHNTIDYALAVAAGNGDVEIVKILLDGGANVNAYDALAQAVIYGYKAIVEKLLQAGAIVNTDDVHSAPLVHQRAGDMRLWLSCF